MDSITHLTQKILVERARQGSQPTDQIPETAPPPYTASEEDQSDDDDSSDSEDGNSESDHSPVRLTINAANSIHGSNNLVPTSPSSLADATKFSAILLHAVNRINASGAAASNRRINVDLTINCGIIIVGDRNVVGNVGLKPRSPQKGIAAAGTLKQMEVGERSTLLGAKRKAEETPDDEPTRQKRHAASVEPEA